MPDKKLTDAEIVKGLEICSNNGDCKECPINPHHGNYGYCTSLAIKAALDLINRLQAQNDKLYETIDYRADKITELEDKLKTAKAEIERLEKDSKRLKKVEMQLDDAMKMYDTIKAEAYKEFAEKLCEGRVSNDNTVILAKCLLKELVGDNQ